MFGLGVALLAGASGAARADLPDDKSGRLGEYQQRHFELTFPSTTSYEIRRGPGTGTASIRVGDSELVRAAQVPELEAVVAEAAWWRGWQQVGLGTLFPLGLYLAFDNFFGNPRAASLTQLPVPVLSFQPARDWRSFGLMVAGMVGATYGAAQWGAFVAEHLNWSWPNLMSPDEARRASERANERLLDELALAPADLLATKSAPVGGPTPAPTPAATASAAPTGEPGTALGHLAAAQAAVKAAHGDGFRLYLVLTSDLADTSGKLARGAWRYLFFHPLRQEAYQVEVPVEGGEPKLAAAPDGYKEQRSGVGLLEGWKLDSTRALRLLEPEIQRRSRTPLLPEAATLLLYPAYGTFAGPVWIMDLGNGPAEVGIGIDAGAGRLVDVGAQTTPVGQPGR